MKVALYARVSTKQQENEAQLNEIRNHIATKANWELYREYIDTASGKDESRTYLDELMQDARKGLFDHVVFWKVDRLARKPLVFYQILEEWNNLGITYSITTINIDTSTPLGKFVIGLLQQVAELEREFIRERVNAGLQVIKDEFKDGKTHVSKAGRAITKLGRPKGSPDQNKRRTSGYTNRWMKESERRKQKQRMKLVNNPPPEKTVVP